jgi:phosphate transport system permease protein
VKSRLFVAVCVLATSVSIVALAVLLTAIVYQGHEHLDGIDREAFAEARAPRAPDSIADLAKVDWAAVAAELDIADLAPLDAVDWERLGAQQNLHYADELARVDWSAVAADQRLALPATLRAVEWPSVSAALLVPGRAWLVARWMASDVGSFVTGTPSRRPEDAGIGPPLVGTVWVCLICGILALPLGVGTAIFLEECKPRGALARRLFAVVQLNITNLAGVPSIVYGIIGLTAFVGMFGLFGTPAAPALTIGTTDDWYYFQLPFGRSVLAGGLTLMLVVLPIVVISAQEALRAVPDSLRQGALALGSTRWQMIRRMTLPAAVPGIMTGSILAMSRAIGEAAPILIICGIVFIRFTPEHLMDEFTALPLQIYDWAGRPKDEFHRIAASGIVVLLAVLLTFNAAAVVIRQKFQRPVQ